MTDFDYRRYSLNNLENWLHDAMSAGEATPQEIYDTIIGVVKENYECYKKQTDQAYELLNLLNANPFSEEVKALGQLWDKEDVLKERDYYEPSMPPWGHSDLEYLANPTLTQDRNSNFPNENTICDRDDPSPECKSAWNDFWSSDDVIDFTHITEDGDIYTNKTDKVVKWRLPVEIDSVSGEYYFTLPEDLLEQTGWKENDSLHWIDNNDGTFSLKKVEESEETKL